MLVKLRCSIHLAMLLFIGCSFHLSCSVANAGVTVKSLTPDAHHAQDNAAAKTFLQSEMTSCVAAQQKIVSFLTSKHIAIGSMAGSLKRPIIEGHVDKEVRSRITVSLPNNHIECRIALGRAPVGSKCVAPCGCTGSQKWVQFAELNKLRRKDPTQWLVCPTCQQRFGYSQFAVYGGLSGNIIGYLLDQKIVLRAIVGTAFVCLSYLSNIGALLSRLLVSRSLWQMYPQWSKLTHIPLALKFWAGKLLLQYLAQQFVRIEKETLFASLTEIETKLIERNLPVGELSNEEELVSP